VIQQISHIEVIILSSLRCLLYCIRWINILLSLSVGLVNSWDWLQIPRS